MLQFSHTLYSALWYRNIALSSLDLYETGKVQKSTLTLKEVIALPISTCNPWPIVQKPMQAHRKHAKAPTDPGIEHKTFLL